MNCGYCRRDFEEVDFGFTAEQVVAESTRCLQCSACCECRVCETVCADIGAIDHFRQPKRLEFTSPAVIVADRDELPGSGAIEGDGIYSAGEFKDRIDMIAVLVAGSAAAGRAMAKAASLRALAPTTEREPLELGDHGGLGFFLCSCNRPMTTRGRTGRLR